MRLAHVHGGARCCCPIHGAARVRRVMQALADMPETVRRNVRGVLTDIDDTLSTGGRVGAAAYAAMERLRAAGLRVVPVTGRPAGWCDHIARMWPVDAIVGENGGLYMIHDAAARKLRRHYAVEETERRRNRARLESIAATVLREVPGCALASDQSFRETDLAIDYREDVEPLSASSAERIADLLRNEGMSAKISSIHVNGWFGGHDKLSMTRILFARGIWRRSRRSARAIRFRRRLAQRCADVRLLSALGRRCQRARVRRPDCHASDLRHDARMRRRIRGAGGLPSAALSRRRSSARTRSATRAWTDRFP